MELILVRHGQPEWARDQAAVVDPGLTELGRRQAEAAAKRLAGLGDASELLVSTAARSLATAEPIAEALGLQPRVYEWLHEIRMPASWEGTPSEEVDKAFRRARGRPREQWWDGMPGGESFRDFHQRVCHGLSATLEERGVSRHPDDPDHLWDLSGAPPRIVVVAHGGTNSVILGHLLGLDPQPWEWERFASDHASVTVLRTTRIASGHIFSLQTFSDVSHLDPGDVTA